MNQWTSESDRRVLECVHVGASELRQGDRVRLRPRGRADVFDMILAGMTATVDTLEQDLEGRVYVAVTVDDDPGKDLGAMRQPGHRFFFSVEEVEPLSRDSTREDVMSDRYRLDPTQSRFTVQAFRTGLLSFLGHNPTFAVRDFNGEIRLSPGPPEELSVQATVAANSLELTDNIRQVDHDDIVGRMRREVLEVARFPQIAFEGSGQFAGKVSENRSRFVLKGRLALHGLTNPLQVEATLIVLGDRAGLGCEFMLPMSAYRIRPVTALGGAIQLKDEVRIAFDLVGQRVQESS